MAGRPTEKEKIERETDRQKVIQSEERGSTCQRIPNTANHMCVSMVLLDRNDHRHPCSRARARSAREGRENTHDMHTTVMCIVLYHAE